MPRGKKFTPLRCSRWVPDHRLRFPGLALHSLHFPRVFDTVCVFFCWQHFFPALDSLVVYHVQKVSGKSSWKVNQLVWSTASSHNMDLPSPVTVVQHCRSETSDGKEPSVLKQSVKNLLSGRFSGKFPGATELLKRQFYFSGRNVPNGNSCSISSKPSLIPVSGLRSRFPVNGTDSYKWQTRYPNESYQS